MDLPAGTRLGPYEVIAPIGAGGMGQVYKARDTRLDRTVALKILPRLLAADPQFQDRFDREARAISQLDHPNICALYDVGRQDGTAYLVMQFLEGETLEDRLRRGALPPAEALPIAMHIADALARAHAAGIIHRDLKPGNIMLTKSGARLLDFGLAKTAAPAPFVEAAQTATARLTAQGTIIGTFQYMAPEQIEAGEADARTDVWAFGCVVYEMLTGERAFDGKSPASVLANILNAPVPPIRDRQPRLPRAIDHLVQRCLEKTPEARWQSMVDVGHELRWAAADTGEFVRAVPLWRQPLAYAAAAALLAIGFIASGLRPRATTAAPLPPLKLSLVAPAGLTFTPFGSNGIPHYALSPDGSRIAFVAAAPGRAPSLWVQRLDSRVAREIPGSSDAAAPFWSPDSQAIAFFGEGVVRRIGLDGERPEVVTKTLEIAGGTWNGSDILIGSATGPILRIGTEGRGPTTSATVLQPGEAGHRWPQFLPDGRHFIFNATRTVAVYVSELGSPTATKLLDEGSTALFAAPSSVLYIPRRSNKLVARALDLSSLTFIEPARDVTEGPRYFAGSGYPPASVSATGLLAYWDGTTVSTDLHWYDREGHLLNAIPAPLDAAVFAVSPDGSHIAYTPRGTDGGIWMMEPSGATSRFSVDAAQAAVPIWRFDGRTVCFTTAHKADGLLPVCRTISGGDGDQVVGTIPLERGPDLNPGNYYVNDWTRDGGTALVSVAQPSTGRDVLAFSAKTGQLTALFTSPAFEIQPRFSPDGRWVAYASNETGRWEVFVETFPRSRVRHQISTAGGSQPVWRGDGKELLFLAPDGNLMSVSVTPGDVWVGAGPQRLFQTRMRPTYAPYPRNYDMTADGKHFLISDVRPDTGPIISLITNWRGPR